MTRRPPLSRPGVQPGDILLAFNGAELTGWEQMGDLIRDNRDGEARVVVERDGQRIDAAEVRTVLELRA